ncbi:hypothetical protein PMAYCL1PPCAC_29673, partial [Pristionchus mayeri]
TSSLAFALRTEQRVTMRMIIAEEQRIPITEMIISITTFSIAVLLIGERRMLLWRDENEHGDGRSKRNEGYSNEEGENGD